MKIDKEKFIANIAAIVNADNILHPREMIQCEKIRERFKFTKTEWKNGEKLASAPGFTFQKTGSFADCIQNLEMMLRVAYADGDLAEQEATKIEAFCKMIGISQEQLDCLNTDVLTEMAEETSICAQCGTELPAGAAFCPSCGCPSNVATSEKLSFEIPAEGVSILFCESNSPAFHRAYELAKANPYFQECTRNRKKWFLAAYKDEITAWKPLTDIVSGLRNKEVYRNGVLCDWHEVFNWEVIRCFDERNKAFNKWHHCFGKSIVGESYYDDKSLNPWGCKLAKMNWSGYASSWFSFGSWLPSTTKQAPIWRFDKEQIRHLFKVNTAKCSSCPYFTSEVLEHVLQMLPDTVCPNDDSHWKYKECYDDCGSNVTSWYEDVKEDDFDGVRWRKITMRREFKTNGIEPADMHYLKQIVETIFDTSIVAGLIK